MWWATILCVAGGPEVPVLGRINQSSDPAWVEYGNSIYPNFESLDLDTFSWFYWDAPLNVTPVKIDVAECKGQLADGTAYVYAKGQTEDEFNEAYNEHGFGVARSGIQHSSPYEVRHYNIDNEHNHGVDYTWFQLAVGTGHFVEADPWICRSYHTCRLPNGDLVSGYDTSLNGTVFGGQLNRELPVPAIIFSEEDLVHAWLGHEGRMLLRQTLVVNGSVEPVFQGEACENHEVVLCRPINGIPRLDGPVCEKGLEQEPHSLFAVAALLSVWAFNAKWKVSRPSVDSLRDLIIGFVIWWPANAIGDGMPLFVEEGANAAAAIFAMTLGNIAVLLPWPQSRNALRALSLLGAASLGLTFVSIEAAAFVAGFAGSGATAIVWGITDNAKSVGIGMTLSAVFSSFAVLVCQTSLSYTIFCIVVASLAMLPVRQPEEKKEVEEALIEEEAPSKKQGNQRLDNSIYFLFYALAYALPGVLPKLKLTVDEYKGIIVLGTVGDIAGRLFSGRSSKAHLPCCIIAFVAIILSDQYASRACLAVAFYALRGDAVTLLASRAGKGTKIGVFGQIGATIGALATALALRSFE